MLRAVRFTAVLSFLLALGGTLSPHPSFGAPPASAAPSSPLDLTPAQQSQYQARVARARQQYNDIQNTTGLTAAEKKAKVEALSKQVDADTLAILTPSQKAFVLQRRAANTAFRKKHAAQIAAAKALQAKIARSLTAAQKAQMQTIATQNNADVAKIAADTSRSEADREKQAAAVRQATSDKMKALLTPAQAADQQRLQQMESDLAKQAAATLPR